MKPSLRNAISDAVNQAKAFRRTLVTLDDMALGVPSLQEYEDFVTEGGKVLADLKQTLHRISPQRFGTVGLTLGRADGIAKFFAFSFVATEKRPLASIADAPFWGSGVYAIYYCGGKEPAYAPLSNAETPIYVGKADPVDAFADSIEAQGQALFRRLREHATNISKTELSLDDFSYREATIQSGMQFAVEEFMIRLFRPIWNSRVGVCHGLGKHGDSAKTRANKRSPWDTMHPGRKWAEATVANQAERHQIVERITKHFASHPVIKDKTALFERLALD